MYDLQEVDMSINRWVSGIICGLGLMLSTSTAHAVSYNGVTLTKLLTLKTDLNQYLGYWRKMNKFLTYPAGASSDAKIGVSEVYSDSSLDNYNIADFYTMGTTAYQFGPTNSEVISLFDDNGLNLLTANLKGTGLLNIIGLNGTAGELKLTGFFDVTSGVLYNNNLVTGTIYATIVFDYLTNHKGKDFYSTTGTIEIYGKAPGNQTNVPEPASMSLLCAGLVGIARRRRKIN